MIRSLLVALSLGAAATASAQFTTTPVATASMPVGYGHSVVPIGDLDGNGAGDYAVGNPTLTVSGKTNAGGVRIQFMTNATTVGSTVDLVFPVTLLAEDLAGFSLAVLTPSPLRLMVGNPGFYGNGEAWAESGRVFVFTINAAGAITATDSIDDTDVSLAEGDWFGSSIAVVSSGAISRLAIGAAKTNCTAGSDCGAVHVVDYVVATGTVTPVRRIGGAGWSGVTDAVAGLPAGGQFGWSVAAGTGSVLYAGAPYADVGGTNRGAVYAMPYDGLGAVTSAVSLDANTVTLSDNAEFGYGLTTPPAGAAYRPSVVIGSPGTSADAGSIWAATFAGGAWTATSESGSPPAARRGDESTSSTQASAMAAGGRYGAGVAIPAPAADYPGIDVLVGAPGAGQTVAGATSGNVLPVELVAFEAVANGARVALRWATASETNNAGFRIEAQGRDGAWQDLGFVAGHGTTTERTAYDFDVPPTLLPGRYTFRLAQLDLDGAVHHGATVEAVVGMDGPALLAVSPNPASGPVRVTAAVREAQAVRVDVIDLLGRRVATLHTGAMAAGEAETWSLPSGTLASGRYMLVLSGAEGARQTASLIVAR
ncbi:MAG: hypothetical protein LCH53_00040 [Bacteroidetes bacterium]|nr:hypothetical protein [Bacteroidota bacterium]